MNQRQLEKALTNLKYNPAANPDPLFKMNAKKRIMNRISSLENTASVNPLLPRNAIFPNFFFRLNRPLRYGFMSFAAFLLLGGGTVFASQSSLPTEPLYPIKTAFEDLLLNAAPLPSWKKDLSSVYVNRRIDEIDAVAEKYGELAAQSALESYEESFNKAKKYGNSSEELEKLGKPKEMLEKTVTPQGGSGLIDNQKENVKGSTSQQQFPVAPKVMQKPKQETKPQEVKPKQEESKRQSQGQSSESKSNSEKSNSPKKSNN